MWDSVSLYGPQAARVPSRFRQRADPLLLGPAACGHASMVEFGIPRPGVTMIEIGPDSWSDSPRKMAM
jgi:hypothetical protein